MHMAAGRYYLVIRFYLTPSRLSDLTVGSVHSNPVPSDLTQYHSATIQYRQI